jgi:hypothetical protein
MASLETIQSPCSDSSDATLQDPIFCSDFEMELFSGIKKQLQERQVDLNSSDTLCKPRPLSYTFHPFDDHLAAYENETSQIKTSKRHSVISAGSRPMLPNRRSSLPAVFQVPVEPRKKRTSFLKKLFM